MGIEKFYKTAKRNASCFFETVQALADLDIDKTLFVYQNHDVILIYDLLGKPLQRDFHVFKT